jgi:hypothetical protein
MVLNEEVVMKLELAANARGENKATRSGVKRKGGGVSTI